jgi:transcriptional regulator with XRE-family HTH domain
LVFKFHNPDKSLEVYEKLATTLEDIRLIKKVKHRAFFKTVGLKLSRLARYKNKSRTPNIDVLSRIANALDLDFIVTIKPKAKPRKPKAQKITLAE